MLQTFLNYLKTTLESNGDVINHDLTVVLWDYDPENKLSIVLNEVGLSVSIKFTEIDKVNEVFNNAIGYQWSGLVEVFEIPIINRVGDEYITGIDLAESILATLLNNNLDAYNLNFIRPQSLKNDPKNFKLKENDGIMYTIPFTIQGIFNTGEVTSSKVTTPVITRSSGTEGERIYITTTTGEASLYYTTDGTLPDASDTLYTSYFYMYDTSSLIKAIGIKNHWDNSETASYSYVGRVNKPTISATSTSAPSTITLNCTTSGSVTRYTLNGDVPIESNTAYTSSFDVLTPSILRVRSFRSDLTSSLTAELQIT